MSARALSVLVTGATGLQGGAVAHALLAKGHAVRALTRKIDSRAAEALGTSGASLVAGDFGDRASLVHAMAGVDAVFAMATPFPTGPSAETRDGISLVEAAKAARVRHFVYSSVCGADKATGIPHFESKWRIEQHLAASDLPFTVVRPVSFMENVRAPQSLLSLQAGRLARPLPPTKTLQRIDVASLASFVAWVVGHRETCLARRIDLASDELSGDEEVALLSQAMGRKIVYVQTPLPEARGTDKDMASMFAWLERVGFGADVAGLRRAHPHIGWQKFADWAKGQSLATAT